MIPPDAVSKHQKGTWPDGRNRVWPGAASSRANGGGKSFTSFGRAKGHVQCCRTPESAIPASLKGGVALNVPLQPRETNLDDSVWVICAKLSS